ncbi:MAG: endopeptidase La [Lachnospiraceae bacterium]|nr:endopeptidase La [Lachnospiraceae bacterium]
MTVVPFYNILIVPGVKLYFQNDYFEELAGKEAEVGDDIVFAMLKDDKQREEVKPDDLYPIGLSGKVESIDDDGNVGIRTLERMDLFNIAVKGHDITLEAVTRPDVEDISEKEIGKILNDMRGAMVNYIQGTQWGMMARGYVMHWKSIGEMMVSLSQQLMLSNDERYEILATDSVRERSELMEKAFYEMLALIKVESEAQNEQAERHEQIYREDAIKKQIEILERKLDELHPENVTDIRKFEQLIRDSGMNKEARDEAEKVLNRMKQEGKDSHEYGMLYDYLDFVTSLCWKKADVSEIDLKKAEEILDENHYGMKKVKKRIIEQMAVMALNKRQSGSILLFVGAPGTGKTSIGQSIAKALGREYVRVSLGGVRDEAEIRGHRRTYIGAMPGRIMDGIKRSGSSNPVMVLDEVDKLTRDMSGDPSSALLEVLDPEQNDTFTDHYVNVPYDLSDVLFVCTANSIDTIPEPLLNRMEMIEFKSYTATEKREIAKRHLIPKAMKAMGLKKTKFSITDKALDKIISDYTMEAGVRGLKKRIDTLCRVAAVKLVKGEEKKVSVIPKKLKEYLDRKPIRHDKMMNRGKAGVVTGLAWTSAGGDILFIETMLVKGKGEIIITGQLGDVMRESAQIAVSLVKHMYPEKAKLFEDHDLHIHVPEGAVPKDGPSAGITLVTALTSLVTGKAVDPDYAMTGEVSLRGGVMPIGGLPEKLMAADRAGIKKVFIPKDNVEDLEDVAEEVKERLTIIPVKKIKDVLDEVLK